MSVWENTGQDSRSSETYSGPEEFSIPEENYLSLPGEEEELGGLHIDLPHDEEDPRPKPYPYFSIYGNDRFVEWFFVDGNRSHEETIYGVKTPREKEKVKNEEFPLEEIGAFDVQKEENEEVYVIETEFGQVGVYVNRDGLENEEVWAQAYGENQNSILTLFRDDEFEPFRFRWSYLSGQVDV